MSTVKLKGGAARNFMAELLVDQDGAAAVEKCTGPMLEAVKRILAERASTNPNKEAPTP